MAIVQTTFEVASGTTPGTPPSLTGVAAGSDLVVGIAMATALAGVSFTVSSDLDGAFTSVVSLTANNRHVELFRLKNVSAGTHTITATASASTTFAVILWESSGRDQSASVVTGTNDTGSSVNTFYGAASGSIDTTGACDIFVVGAMASGATGTQSPGASPAYTDVGMGSTLRFAQYRSAGAAVTDDRGEWTSTSTARRGLGCMVAILDASGGTDMPTDAGSYAVTGSAASLLRHRVLTADAGSYAITGSAADLSRGYVVVTDAGSYLLTGANADLVAARRLIADPGSYTITGSAADLVYASDAELATDPGVYTLTGAEASLLVHRVLLADPGSYAVTGADAGLARGYLLTTDPGSYTLTGSDATFARDYAVHTEAGAYSLTGFAATLLKSGDAELTADPGVYALTGANALMLVHRVLHADPGSYTLTGSAAGLVIPYRLEAFTTRRLRRAPHLNDEDRWLLYRMLQVDLEAGTGTATGQGADPEIMLRWSDDDGETWQGPITVTAGRMGAYGHRAIWRQLGRSRDRVFEVSVSDPVRWSLMAAYLNVDRGTS